MSGVERVELPRKFKYHNMIGVDRRKNKHCRPGAPLPESVGETGTCLSCLSSGIAFPACVGGCDTSQVVESAVFCPYFVCRGGGARACNAARGAAITYPQLNTLKPPVTSDARLEADM